MKTYDMHPVTSQERIAVIDVLRGVAIFGILMVNVLYFFNPWYAPMTTADSTTGEHVVKFITNTFFVSKFYTLFSFLFGLGMAIQMGRAQAKEAPFLPLYLRRLLVLAIFGVVHGVFLWTGDILLMYAVIGFLTVILFRNRSPKTLLVWALVFLALPVLFIALSAGLVELARAAPPETGAFEQVQEAFAAAQEEIRQEVAAATEAYRHGSWWTVTRYRASEFFSLVSSTMLFMAPTVLGMFLLGLRAGKKGWFTNISANHALFRRLLAWALPIGLVLNLFVGATGFEQNKLGIDIFTLLELAQVTALAVGSVLLSLSYIAGIVLLSRTATGARLLTPLAPVGRMALTNYIAHSVVMSTLAYGYGVGMFSTTSLVTGFLLAIALYAVQIPVSAWWLRRHRYGPLEWLWRRLTYGTV
ncbi:MAG: DUF418 domain-containing protein [Alkalispirochaeta sp.]